MRAWKAGVAMLGSSHIVAFAATTDLHRARVFYEQVLGLPVAEHNDFACVLDANGTMLRITATPEVRQAGYTVLGWRVTDITAAIRGLAARGVVFRAMRGWTRIATVSGPLPAETRWPGSPTLTAMSCRSPSSFRKCGSRLPRRGRGSPPGRRAAGAGTGRAARSGDRGSGTPRRRRPGRRQG